MSLYLNKPIRYILYTINNKEGYNKEEDEDGIYDENDFLETEIEEINKRNKMRKQKRDAYLRQFNNQVQTQLQEDQQLQLLNQLQHQQNIQMLKTYQQRTNYEK